MQPDPKQVAVVNKIRSEADNYATTKSITQVIMNGGTIAINVTLFRQIHNRDVEFQQALIGLIWTSVALNCAVIVLASLLSAQVPQDPNKNKQEDEYFLDGPSTEELLVYFRAQLRLLDNLINGAERKDEAVEAPGNGLPVEANRNQVFPAWNGSYPVEILDPAVLKLKLRQLRESSGIAGESYINLCCTTLGCWSPLIPTSGCHSWLPFNLQCFLGTSCDLPEHDETPLVKQARAIRPGNRAQLIRFKNSLTRYLGFHRHSGGSGYLLFSGAQVFTNNIITFFSVAVIILNIIIASLAPSGCPAK